MMRATAISPAQRYSPFARRLLPIVLALLPASPVLATNGMNLEAYGAKAGGMGGAAFAYDSGNSAAMNNPATLLLKPAGKANLGVGLTLLAPDVTSSHALAGSVDSKGTAYWMPTIGYTRRQDGLAYGVALLAQGGMGTEYGAGSSLFAGGLSAMNNPVALSGEEIRSELSFGRLMFPLAWQATERLGLAGQIDLAWAGLDLKMDMDGQTVAGMMGAGLVNGGLAGALGGLGDLHYARFNFSDKSAITGSAKGHGTAVKLGALYKASDKLNVGVTYHSRTHIADLKSSKAQIQADGSLGSASMNGEIRVMNFQWPETFGIGLAYAANEKWLWAADIKQIGWADSMKNFRFIFTDAGSGQSLDVNMPQNWKNQTVYALGAQYKPSADLALRVGFNQAGNPVPDNTLNPLFPATVERHYTAGFGYRLNPTSSVDAAITLAPEAVATNPVTGITSRHSQMSLRANYSHKF